MIRDAGGGPPDRERRRQIARWVVMGVVALLVVLVVLDNRRSVRVGWVLGDADVSLIVVILLAVAAGAVVGSLATWQRRRR